MLVTKELELDAGHRVPSHKGKCRHMHGHRYRVELGVDDKVINEKGKSDEGMVIDFSELKKVLIEEIEANFDHRFILYRNDQHLKFQFTDIQKEVFGIVEVDFIPTAENLAKHWYELCKVKLQQRGIKIKYVKVWETPSSTAKYEE